MSTIRMIKKMYGFRFKNWVRFFQNDKLKLSELSKQFRQKYPVGELDEKTSDGFENPSTVKKTSMEHTSEYSDRNKSEYDDNSQDNELENGNNQNNEDDQYDEYEEYDGYEYEFVDKEKERKEKTLRLKHENDEYRKQLSFHTENKEKYEKYRKLIEKNLNRLHGTDKGLEAEAKLRIGERLAHIMWTKYKKNIREIKEVVYSIRNDPTFTKSTFIDEAMEQMNIPFTLYTWLTEPIKGVPYTIDPNMKFEWLSQYKNKAVELEQKAIDNIRLYESKKKMIPYDENKILEIEEALQINQSILDQNAENEIYQRSMNFE